MAVISLFFLSVRYFIRILITMRVLDVIIVFLERRLRDLKEPGKLTDSIYKMINGIYLPNSFLSEKRK
jgi:hypothetical protein